MDQEAIRRAIMRMAHEILEKASVKDLALIGIRTRGVVLAQRLKDAIKGIEGREILSGVLDITLYRDDLTLVGAKPIVRQRIREIKCSLEFDDYQLRQFHGNQRQCKLFKTILRRHKSSNRRSPDYNG